MGLKAFRRTAVPEFRHSGGMNCRGQAAITDALFLLLIVAGLSAFMFSISGTFGINVNKNLESLYGADYAASALQTILYSSVPRVPGENIEDTSEVDYLLAMIKEDYASDSALSGGLQDRLRDSVGTVMDPLKQAYDYFFYIYIPPQQFDNEDWIPADEKNAFVFVLLYTAEYTQTGEHEFSGERKTYYCFPKQSGEIKTDNDLDRLLFLKVGEINKPPSVLVNFRKLKEEGPEEFTQHNFQAYVDLLFWPAKPLPQAPDGSKLTSEEYLNCSAAP